MLDEVKLRGAVTAPGQLFLAQNARKTGLTFFGFFGLDHLVDRPAFASDLHHPPNMRPCRPEIHSPYSGGPAHRRLRLRPRPCGLYSAARPMRIPSRCATTSSRCITSAYL